MSKTRERSMKVRMRSLKIGRRQEEGAMWSREDNKRSMKVGTRSTRQECLC